MPDTENLTKPVTQDDDEEYQEDDDDEEDESGEAATCNVLCSLGSSDINVACSGTKKDNAQWDEFTNSNHCCPKQLQLPMFLSSTFNVLYHTVLLELCSSNLSCF
jgi:hypothetical protein